MRRRVLGGTLRAGDARAALDLYASLPITRFDPLPFVARAFALRDNVTFYDALYLVLAEVVGATLITRDSALAAVPGTTARVRVLA